MFGLRTNLTESQKSKTGANVDHSSKKLLPEWLWTVCVIILVEPNIVLALCQEIKPESSNSQDTTPSGDSTNIEVVAIDPVIVLKGSINGRGANVLFDTGAWPNAIGTHRSATLAGEVEEISVGGHQIKVCSWDNLVIGGEASNNEGPIGLVDMKPFNSSLRIEVDAIAGTPFAAGRAFEIDFENSRFRMLESSPNPAFPIAERFTYDELGRPWIEIRLGARNELFMIHTGFDGFLSVDKSLSDYIFKNLPARESGEHTLQLFDQDSRSLVEGKAQTLVIAQQHFFGFEFTKVPVVIDDRPESINLIGLGVLSAFDVFMDFRDGTFQLRKNQVFDLRHGCTVLPK